MGVGRVSGEVWAGWDYWDQVRSSRVGGWVWGELEMCGSIGRWAWGEWIVDRCEGAGVGSG